MNEVLRAQFANLPEYLSRHLLLTATALSAGIGLSLPLAVLAVRVRPLRGPLLAVASVVQTIPSLALLALMVPLLRRIGFLPAALALVVYSMLPVIRNTVTGIEEVDPNLIEAGRGLGMTPAQLLRRVQLPLAMPVIVAGIRTATVWVVGIATLSTPVGATSLGDYIFSGLQTRNFTSVVFGCVAAGALALILDGLIRLVEVACRRRRRGLAVLATAGLLAVVGAGLAPTLLARPADRGRRSVLVGAKTFTEQYILSEFIVRQLESTGHRAATRKSLGSTIAFDALAAGQIDCYVDYTGTIWANHMGRTEPADADAVLRAVTSWLRSEHGIECMGRLGFENTYALAMPREAAARLAVKTIDDLVRHAAALTIGGDYEFFARPEWTKLQEAYGVSFAETVSMDGSLMYSAVAADELDVIAAFSTDGRIEAFDLLVLEDPRSVFPPYDAVLLLGGAAASDPNVREALRPLLGTLDDDRMRHANMRVDVDGSSVDSVARALHRRLVE